MAILESTEVRESMTFLSQRTEDTLERRNEYAGIPFTGLTALKGAWLRFTMELTLRLVLR